MDAGGGPPRIAEESPPGRTRLRRRVALFFLLIGTAALGLFGAALVMIAREAAPEGMKTLSLYGGGALFVLLGLVAWVGVKFDETVAQPIDRIARDLRAAAFGGAPSVDPSASGRHLGMLGAAARSMAAALAEARAETDASVALATRMAERRRRQLETVLRDLEQGVLICATNHRVTLYNRRALDLLGVAGDLGLGRSVFSLVAAQPLRHALDRVTMRFEDGRHRDHPLGLGAPFVAATADGGRTLRGRLTLMLNEEESAALGYIVSFEDATDALADQLRRDRLLRESAEALRKPASNLRAVADLLPDAVGEERRRLLAQLDLEADRLAARLSRLECEAQALAAGAWPMSDMFSTALFASAIRRRTGAQNFSAEIVGQPCWLHGDSVALVEMLDTLLNRIADSRGVRAFSLQAIPQEGRVAIEILWRGAPATEADLKGWLAEPLDAAVAGVTSLELLDLHRATIWSDDDHGAARLRITLPGPLEAHLGRPRPQAARPEFYDFDLLDRPAPALDMRTPLRALDYVVFDTETTGLDPRGSDRVLSIAGVRVVNGRVLRGESFDRLMHPGRPIPPASTKVHHITDAMVRDAPPIAAVLPRFHAFVGDSVLVAHNAAFDMAFLAKEEAESGVRFDQPTLDTVLLAAHLHGQSDSLTLDALAERFAIDIPPEARHTALGDSLATAELLLRLFDMLEAVGVRTLGDALEASRAATAIRRKQAAY
jgi:DNA polymerase-3 subunit epsilon